MTTPKAPCVGCNYQGEIYQEILPFIWGIKGESVLYWICQDCAEGNLRKDFEKEKEVK